MKMIEDHEEATEILPAWFIPRMMTDDWCFALVLITGQTMFISRITAISEDGAWIDVRMLSDIPFEVETKPWTDKSKSILCINSAQERGRRDEASVHVFSIVAAYEVAST